LLALPIIHLNFSCATMINQVSPKHISKEERAALTCTVSGWQPLLRGMRVLDGYDVQ
jgi:hypothetical protein